MRNPFFTFFSWKKLQNFAVQMFFAAHCGAVQSQLCVDDSSVRKRKKKPRRKTILMLCFVSSNVFPTNFDAFLLRLNDFGSDFAVSVDVREGILMRVCVLELGQASPRREWSISEPDFLSLLVGDIASLLSVLRARRQLLAAGFEVLKEEGNLFSVRAPQMGSEMTVCAERDNALVVRFGSVALAAMFQGQSPKMVGNLKVIDFFFFLLFSFCFFLLWF